jgi:hypothetical protein
MAKRYGIKRASSRDPLSVQITVRCKLPKGSRPEQLTASLIDEAIKYRIENGEDHPAFVCKIVRWKNPARKGKNAGWRQGNQADAWTTLGPQLKDTNVAVITPPRRRRR